MHETIAWVGFLGAWFLVAGPVYQAALELRDEDTQRDELMTTISRIPRSEPPSPWWWLLPPVHYLLSRRRARDDRNRLIAALSLEQLRALADYMNKATGWLLVATGGLFIAVKETYELAEVHEWPIGVLVGLVLVMAALAVGYTVARMLRVRTMLREHEQRYGARPADDATTLSP